MSRSKHWIVVPSLAGLIACGGCNVEVNEDPTPPSETRGTDVDVNVPGVRVERRPGEVDVQAPGVRVEKQPGGGVNVDIGRQP